MVPELFGFAIGVIAGLIPGIHPNTFASLMLTTSPILLQHFESHEVALIIFISSTVYTVVNIIPAAFIGVPDEDTAIAAFPAHRMVMEGDGFKAASISAISSFLASLISVPAFYLLIMAGESVRELMILTPLVLTLVLIHLVMLERDEFGGSLASWRKRGYAIAVMLSSGALGYYSTSVSCGSASVLFPLLSGLFAFPTLIAGMTSTKIPEQRIEVEFPGVRAVLRGAVSGLFVSLFPGISSGVATAISVGREDGEKEYISAVSAANTANAILNFAVLISAGMVRSGTAHAFSEISRAEDFSYLPLIALASAFAGLSATLLLSVPAARAFSKINPSRISKLVLAFLILAVFISCGFAGLAVFAVASLIGLSTLALRVRRIHCMGAVIIPALLH
ncbi:tripartite tricarboxylate transporter permease [Geoglobus ahangari]